jgi:hypothetical protein
MDTYTKGVLTVIAICLVSITFQLSGTQTIKNAEAEGSPNAREDYLMRELFDYSSSDSKSKPDHDHDYAKSYHHHGEFAEKYHDHKKMWD